MAAASSWARSSGGGIKKTNKGRGWNGEGGSPTPRRPSHTHTHTHTKHNAHSTFADGFPNLFVKDATRIRNRHVAFLASFQSPASIFEQLSIIYQLPRMFVGSFTLVLPYFPTGTAERVEAEGDVATAVTLARILSHIPLSRGGPTSVVIFDIHALQERFYFGDTVLPLFESGIPLLRARLASLPDRESITIAYPDEGAWKRFHYQFGDYPEVICTKVGREGGAGRRGEEREGRRGVEVRVRDHSHAHSLPPSHSTPLPPLTHTHACRSGTATSASSA